MTANDDDPFAALIRKVEQLATLNDADRRAIRALPFTVAHAPAGKLLVREGELASKCSILLTGYACRHKTTSEGERQIVSFHIPGDILDLQHLLLSQADHNVQTITEVSHAAVPTTALRQVVQAHPNIAEALWRDSLIDASIFREWVLNVGRRDAKSRVAHMLCEFAARREAAGIGPPDAFELPMTQEHIADATGLTTIHVNRMLAQLGSEGLIKRDRRHVQIVDWGRMCEAADFDAGYLHLRDAA